MTYRPRLRYLFPFVTVLLAWLAPGCETITQPPSPGDDPLPPPDTITLQTALAEHVPAVVRVTGTVAADGSHPGEVSYSIDGNDSLSAPFTLIDGAFEALLVGLKPATDYRVQAQVYGPDWSVESEPVQVTTGPLPAELPALSLTVGTPEDGPGGFIVTTLVADEDYAVILDGDGEIVWWRSIGNGSTATARLSPDRSELWTLGGGKLMVFGLDGTVVEKIESVGGAHHDFTFTDDDHLAYLTSEQRTIEGCGEEIVGDAIVEMDLATGEMEYLSFWDLLEFDCSDITETQQAYPIWGHANAIDYDPFHDAYIVSFYFWEALYAIDRQTGAVLWILGGEDSSFRFDDGSEKWFASSHQFHLLEDRILVFDNGDDLMQSRIIGYELDFDRLEVSSWFSWTTEPETYVYALGDISMLANDQVLSTWSTAGQLILHGPNFRPVWQLNVALGHGLGYSTWVPSLYP